MSTTTRDLFTRLVEAAESIAEDLETLASLKQAEHDDAQKRNAMLDQVAKFTLPLMQHTSEALEQAKKPCEACGKDDLHGHASWCSAGSKE